MDCKFGPHHDWLCTTDALSRRTILYRPSYFFQVLLFSQRYSMVLFRRLAVASVSELKMVSPTSALQSGHVALIFSHLSTQSLWKKWEHGSSLSSSLLTYFAKQMQQTCRGDHNSKVYKQPNVWKIIKLYVCVCVKLTASSPDIARSFSVPAATIPPSDALELFSLLFLLFFILNLYVGRELIESWVAPRFWEKSSLMPRTDIIQGRQQQIVAHRIKGIAYPMQLKVRNTMHNL